MASSKEYLQFILGQLAELEEISYRAMMGEFIIYYCGKIVGGIYDDRLLVKPVKAALSYLWEASYELPYEGAKEMLLVDEVDDKEFLQGLFVAMYEELPEVKGKKKKQESNKIEKVRNTDYVQESQFKLQMKSSMNWLSFVKESNIFII